MIEEKIISKLSSIPDRHLLETVEKYCAGIISIQIDLHYHRLEHTQSAVHWTNQLGKKERIDEHKLFLLLIAAWFHDTGFAFDYESHEKSSTEIMEQFLIKDIPSVDILFIKKCILVTHISQKPRNIYESILCDADLAHLRAPDYKLWHARLRKEWEVVLGKFYSDQDWYKLNREFLRKHTFYTQSANDCFNATKNINSLEFEFH